MTRRASTHRACEPVLCLEKQAPSNLIIGTDRRNMTRPVPVFWDRTSAGASESIADMPLETYRKKRNPSRTSEPVGKKRGRRKRSGEKPIFVIQKHDASTLHYDFRIEVDGVLKSWAVPKGPSTDPREKRLAVPTEDHPLSYADFEGTIPEGEYGGGTVLIWDRGTYKNVTEKNGEVVPLAKALDRGHALIRLSGKKLTGGYALQRIGKDKKKRWLLVKMNDRESDARRNPVSTQPKSVLSGRTVKQIAESEREDPDEA